jgi:hypothetical protein
MSNYLAINVFFVALLCFSWGILLGYGWGYETAQRVAKRTRKRPVKPIQTGIKKVDIPWFVPRRSRRTAA